MIHQNKEYEVLGIGTCKDTDIVIPSSLDGKPITSIGDHAFSGCSSLTSITIPSSVTSIGSSAFYGCCSLTMINFEDTDNWYRTTDKTNWINKTGGTQISLTNPSTNVRYFTSTYSTSCWYKS